MPTIHRLDPKVVNQIAAGEVIQRPSNALKELIENALDAKATSIRITAHQGGLKSLLIQDNGTGIDKEDLPLVCERFATSKLTELKDLESIQSFGFRGEALASISHVAHVTITTKTNGSPCAYKAHYRDGALAASKSGTSDPVPCAGTVGTQILVEDLFFNLKTRRQALKNTSEEYNQIVDVVAKYGIHNASSGVGFVCKKFRESTADVSISNRSSTLDAIRNIYGQATARELLEFQCSDQTYRELESGIHFKCHGYFSNANYSIKKSRFIIFINNRLVTCPAIKRSFEALYATYLPKSGHPFVYLSLTIPGQNIDVNVHPTKQQVHFLFEDEIVQALTNGLEEKLKGANTSRTFYAQTILNSATDVVTTEQQAVDDGPSQKKRKQATPFTPHKAVRTDPNTVLIDRFTRSQDPNGPSSEEDSHDEEDVDGLSSVQNLRTRIQDQQDRIMAKILRNHTFVGAVDAEFCLIQYQTKLYLISTMDILSEYFYQQIMQRFGKLSSLHLATPLSLKELALVALDSPKAAWTPEDGPKDEIAAKIAAEVTGKADMLADYFNIGIDKATQCICKLPQLGPEPFVPSLAHLPELILDLETEVDYDEEETCFDTIAQAIARCYSYLDDEEPDQDYTRTWILEHVFSPEWKNPTSFVPSRALRQKERIWQVACVENLYKIFERC